MVFIPRAFFLTNGTVILTIAVRFATGCVSHRSEPPAEYAGFENGAARKVLLTSLTGRNFREAIRIGGQFGSFGILRGKFEGMFSRGCFA